MAYWFHRNPLKATTPVTFELHGVSTNDVTRKIFSDLRTNRNKLLEHLTDPNHTVETMEKTANEYFSLLQGLYMEIDSKEPENKLRKVLAFRWTNTLLGNNAVEARDAVFEHVSMAINVALWYTKHAAKLAAKDEPDMEEAKAVHRCLRTAAGIFKFVKETLVPKLIDSFESGTDTDTRVLDAYIKQCTAEAQEVTLARAVELKHASGLVAALAYETSQIYTDADTALSSLDEKVVGKWRKYFQLKSSLYLACAHSYNGETLLAQDKCGEAIRGLQEGVKMYEKAELLCKEYAVSKGAGTTARPQNHLFFRKLGPVIRRTLEKCERENGLIYHQKVAYDPPHLELKATYGLVSPEEYKNPSLNSVWIAEVYNKFDTSRLPQPEKKKADDKPPTLAPVKEKETPMSDKDPQTFSGCIVS
ncbi:LOW QUALITY PROTEIN: BRO1 domain-containing protein BROX-like [Pomacea canaliculata]|uniref:LOW QUALITY PROTEIN: BRO1 domain-containing protein BROX-like n=1 Tax=Pomacea canaliculata TaxID=400727 RepID=UPI000D73F49A|nr:LOW QUALITY PROTEIN: BRO1 domain-containing protein BROX-like [Pomacea canaliculata]